jgi:hypothetical protein
MLDDLTKMISLLVVLSVAAERLVEILRAFVLSRWISSWYQVQTDPVLEARRQAKVWFLALVASLSIAILLKEVGELAVSWGATLVLGFLASGGSSLWNSILGLTKGLKDIRQFQGNEARKRKQAPSLPLDSEPLP